jgi:hemin uptake protein HemP
MTPAGNPNSPPTPSPAMEKPQRLPSSRLFGDASTVEIEHCGQCYVLRVTRENKLILTK